MLLSILIPSNRDISESLLSITSAFAASSAEVEVIVSDNSRSILKTNILRSITNKYTVVIDGPADAAGNFRNAFEHATGKYILMMGDDDQIMPAGINNLLDFMKQKKSRVLTGFLIRDMGNAYDLCRFTGLNSPDLATRVISLGLNGKYGNPVFNTIIDRKVALTAFDFILSMPLRLSHCDILYSLYIITSSAIFIQSPPHFIYNAKNWKNYKDGLRTQLNHAKYDKYPASISLISRLILAFEGYCIINQVGREHISDVEKVRVSAQIWASRYIDAWRVALLRKPWPHEIQSCPHLTHFMKVSQSIQDAINIKPDALLDFITAYYNAVGLDGESYFKFWEAALKRNNKPGTV